MLVCVCVSVCASFCGSVSALLRSRGAANSGSFGEELDGRMFFFTSLVIYRKVYRQHELF